jgi:2-methylcitrate dehydratase PrpD
MSTTAAFSEWAVETRFESLPSDVVRAVRRLVEESVAVSVLGSGMTLGRQIGASMGFSDVPYAVATDEDVTSPSRAAFVNAAWADCNDSAGGSYSAPLHPAKNLIPAAMAVALTIGASGQELLRAVAVGTEFAFRLDAAIGLEHMARGHYSDGPIGALASAVAVGALAGLDADQLAGAIGIAALLAPATVGGEAMWVSSGRPLALGRAAASGVDAVAAAATGMVGPVEALGCGGGFAEALSGRSDLTAVTENLGEHWHSVAHYLKPFVGCKLTHPAREGLQLLKRDEALQPEDVARIVVDHPRYDIPVIGHLPKPGDTEVAYSCSSPYLMACSLLYDELGPEVLADRRMNDPAVHELAARISIVEDPAMTELYAKGMSARGEIGTPIRMVVERVSGPPLTYATHRVTGDPFEGWEVSDAALDEKFLHYVDGRLDPDRSTACLRELATLEAVDDLRSLRASLVPKHHSLVGE